MAKSNVPSAKAWALVWWSRNRLDGERRHMLREDFVPLLFATRREARDYAAHHYGYVRTRPDLRNEPHGWRMPYPIRVTIEAARDG
jgi:hypothetical protein